MPNCLTFGRALKQLFALKSRHITMFVLLVLSSATLLTLPCRLARTTGPFASSITSQNVPAEGTFTSMRTLR